MGETRIFDFQVWPRSQGALSMETNALFQRVAAFSDTSFVVY
jgi:hypothetical protein